MQSYLAVTDYNWWRFLAGLQPDEVNFWQPSSGQAFRALKQGEPFLFKLKSPHNAIAGGAFFISYTQLPLSLAWDTFGLKNGMPDYQSLASKIRGLRRDRTLNPSIGCIVLTSPFFFAKSDWIPVPPDWSKNIVRGKTYNLQERHGARLWKRVRAQLATQRAEASPESSEAPLVAEELAQYGSEYVARNRLGQGSFRTLVTDAYERRCAFTGEKTLPALQASHIKPYASSGPHRVNNGLLLRADVHQLFDRGYMTLTKDLQVEVSKRIKEEFENGKAYYALHGQPLQAIPTGGEDQPSATFIEYHNTEVFAS